MNWIILIIAGLCETGFAFCLGKGNLATGHKAVMWYVAFAALCLLSMALLTKATKTIPLGTAYPVWTGIGAVGTVIIGILIFKEPIMGLFEGMMYSEEEMQILKQNGLM